LTNSSSSEEPSAPLSGYSEIMGFGHSRERAVELEVEVRAFMADIARLWDVDVEGYEMAVRFDPAPQIDW
jgi:hypothetical protein